MRIGFPRGLIAGLALAISFGVGTAAHAQHVVTEAEASKLTLEALTAPPPPPRPIYRAYVRRAMARTYVTRGERSWGRHEGWNERSLHAAAFSRASDGYMVRRGGTGFHARHHRR